MSDESKLKVFVVSPDDVISVSEVIKELPDTEVEFVSCPPTMIEYYKCPFLRDEHGLGYFGIEGVKFFVEERLRSVPANGGLEAVAC